jgi:hypothetical protein
VFSSDSARGERHRDSPVPGLASLGQCGEKALVIQVIAEDRFAVIAAVHDVIDRPRILHSQFARHAPDVRSPGLRVKALSTIAGTDTFFDTFFLL